MPHLSLADLLFIAALTNIPSARRPWGAITWLADVFRISRVSVYAVGKRVVERLQGPAKDRLLAGAPQAPQPCPPQMLPVTPTRLARTILTATFPGNVSIRPTKQLLQEAQLIAQHDTYAQWLGHLYDAFELVDRRSGEIREPETNAWLLEQVLSAMEQIDQSRVRKFAKTLRNHQKQLLTFLDWAALAMTVSTPTGQHISSPREQKLFVRTVARCWLLRQALINGHQHWKAEANQAKAALLSTIAADDKLAELATQLMQLLDATGRTSSLVKNINGILKSFFYSRQSFRNLETLQAYLNLFTLWHNMRVYERGKRQGSNPYQLADIDPGSDDWLALLGYPPS